MKISYSTSFARTSLLSTASVVILAVIGWLSANSGNLTARSIHPYFAAFTALLMIGLLFEAWRKHRDHQVILPLTTMTVALFFAQAFIGSILVTRDFSYGMRIFHAITATAVWIALIGLIVTAGLYSRPSSAIFPPFDLRQRLVDFFILIKPVIVLLLLVTTYAGMVTGAKSFPSFSLTFWTLLGGACAAGGASALNQYIDRNLDQFMQRTAKRPLAAGRMTPAEGLSFGLAVCVIGIYIHAGFVNFLTAGLSLAGILYYVILYSVYLKKATVQNIVIGGGAGAIPPMVGWAAATGSLTLTAWSLFALVFFWTPPHFWALAIVRAKDYERAGIPMMPVILGEKETRRQIFVYTLGLVALTLIMPMLGMAGTIYFALALVFGGGLIFAAWRVYRLEGNKVAWQMYRYSSMYLAFIFLSLMIDALL